MNAISTQMGIWGRSMAGELDPVSEILGSLKESRTALEKRLDSIGDKLDQALPKVQDHDKRLKDVETTLKPLVDAHNRRVWVGIGWVSAVGAAGSFPLWATKLLPFLAALPK